MTDDDLEYTLALSLAASVALRVAGGYQQDKAERLQKFKPFEKLAGNFSISVTLDVIVNIYILIKSGQT